METTEPTDAQLVNTFMERFGLTLTAAAEKLGYGGQRHLRRVRAGADTTLSQSVRLLIAAYLKAGKLPKSRGGLTP